MKLQLKETKITKNGKNRPKYKVVTTFSKCKATIYDWVTLFNALESSYVVWTRLVVCYAHGLSLEGLEVK